MDAAPQGDTVQLFADQLVALADDAETEARALWADPGARRAPDDDEVTERVAAHALDGVRHGPALVEAMLTHETAHLADDLATWHQCWHFGTPVHAASRRAGTILGRRLVSRWVSVGAPDALAKQLAGLGVPAFEAAHVVWYAPDDRHDDLFWGVVFDGWAWFQDRWGLAASVPVRLRDELVSAVRDGTYVRPDPQAGRDLTDPAVWREILEARSAAHGLDWPDVPPADEVDLAMAEALLGHALPPTLAAFYRVADGWPARGDGVGAILPVTALRPLSRAHPALHATLDGTDDAALRTLRDGVVLSPTDATHVLAVSPSDTSPDGEWRAVDYDPTSGRAVRHPRFADLFLARWPAV